MVIDKSHIFHSFCFIIHSFLIFLRNSIREHFFRVVPDDFCKYFNSATSIFRYEFRIMLVEIKFHIASINDILDIIHSFVDYIHRKDSAKPVNHFSVCTVVQLIITWLKFFPLFETKTSKHLTSKKLFWLVCNSMYVVSCNDFHTVLSCHFSHLWVNLFFEINTMILDLNIKILSKYSD